MNNAKLLPLTTWARQQYGDAMPHINTLRKWVRDGRIQPQPQKQGRAYFVTPIAEYK